MTPLGNSPSKAEATLRDGLSREEVIEYFIGTHTVDKVDKGGIIT